jgi:hypothetical protein
MLKCALMRQWPDDKVLRVEISGASGKNLRACFSHK